MLEWGTQQYIIIFRLSLLVFEDKSITMTMSKCGIEGASGGKGSFTADITSSLSQVHTSMDETC